MAQRYKLIGCEILFREICLCAARSRNVIDLTFMPKSLHGLGEKAMSETLQEAINDVDTQQYSAILLCYGLCSYGVKGLRADIPIAIPRAHDCITLFMGAKEIYMDYFQKNPGTYFHTSGWLERGSSSADGTQSSDNVMSQLGISRSMDYAQYAEKYGEDNAEYLMEILGNWTKNYKKYAYIDTGVGESAAYEVESIAEAQNRGWEHETVRGDVRLIQALMDGDWDDEDFLVVPPGNEIIPIYGDSIIGCKPV